MQYTIVHRDPQAFQQAVASEQIKAMCEQAFGQGTPINLVRELDGGQFNNTYLSVNSSGKHGDHLARSRQLKTDLHRPFSTTFMRTVTNCSKITTISTEKDVKEIATLASRSGG
jgi:G:T/U-mismatch repair DNA glycosylase